MTRTSRIAIASLLLTATALAACRETIDGPTAALLNDPAKRHPITYAPRNEALLVEVPRGRDGLSPNQVADVQHFLSRYKAEAHGPLSIAAPGQARGALAASRSYRDIEVLVDRAGIPPEAVRHSRGRGTSGEGPVVTLAYDRPVAMGPACGDWPDDLGRVGGERLAHEGFGCATQRNLALTVANARDLQVPQAETPRSGERRSQSWSSYVGSSSGASGVTGSSSSAGASTAPPTGSTQ